MQNSAVRIHGKVSSYSDTVRSGTVTGDDRETYLFSHKEWLAQIPPMINLEISFTTHKGWAKSILLVVHEPAPDSQD